MIQSRIWFVLFYVKILSIKVPDKGGIILSCSSLTKSKDFPARYEGAGPRNKSLLSPPSPCAPEQRADRSLTSERDMEGSPTFSGTSSCLRWIRERKRDMKGGKDRERERDFNCSYWPRLVLLISILRNLSKVSRIKWQFLVYWRSMLTRQM